MNEREQFRSEVKEAIFLEDLRFKKGKRDYQEFASGRKPAPSLVVEEKEYELNWWVPFLSSRDYIQRFRQVLLRTEERASKGEPSYVRLKGWKGLTQFLPIQEEDIKRQFFGFGWAALEAEDLRVALYALRAAGALGEDQVVRQLKRLAAEREEVRRHLKFKWLLEKATERGAKHRLETGSKKAQKALNRARQTLEALEEILTA